MSPIVPNDTMMDNSTDLIPANMENKNKIKFEVKSMNPEEKKILNSYKKELAKESLCMENDSSIKVDMSFLTALNNEDVIELDLDKLNGKQKFLLTNCMKDLEKGKNPKLYEQKVKGEKRKKNNECAAKFRKKRKTCEIKNEVVREHIDNFLKTYFADSTQVENIKRVLVERKAKYSVDLLDKFYRKMKKVPINIERPKPISLSQTQADVMTQKQSNLVEHSKEEHQPINNFNKLDLNSSMLQQFQYPIQYVIGYPSYPSSLVPLYCIDLNQCIRANN